MCKNTRRKKDSDIRTRSFKIPKGEDFYPGKSFHVGRGSIYNIIVIDVMYCFFRNIYAFIFPMIVYMGMKVLIFVGRG